MGIGEGGRYECKILSQGRVKCADACFQEKNAYEETYGSVPITDTGGLVE